MERIGSRSIPSNAAFHGRFWDGMELALPCQRFLVFCHLIPPFTSHRVCCWRFDVMKIDQIEAISYHFYVCVKKSCTGLIVCAHCSNEDGVQVSMQAQPDTFLTLSLIHAQHHAFPFRWLMHDILGQ